MPQWIELLVPNSVKVILTLPAVASLELAKGGDHFVRSVPDHHITANQILVVINQGSGPIVQDPVIHQIKKNRSASSKRLKVVAKIDWIVPANLGKQLTLSAGPLQ
jgi:hypothetical protein